MKTQAKTPAERSAGTSKTNLETVDIYRKFNDLIIEKLEQGVIPWKQPWHKMGMPADYLT